ncbi:hypothetical protein [Gluconacetobacter entanii]|uniref:Uncharacterized protein n=1 Tax=Gluconacetobacter entanii TaxID=108528 RepID=A0A318Q056_9PROT|nr:hypothetical protein [Gluconacetobacter entanii]MCE2578058.1 hypothetical protein [Komagataeibacter sp. FNDCR1]PYD61983.1 hypothetical protein CFR72_13525 [Gluconacetobacter entanii]
MASQYPEGPRPSIAYRPAFAAGIISPMLRFRSDMEKWQTGACELTNFFVHVQGGASNRPGTQYVGAVKDATSLPRLVPFVYNNTQSYVLEMGNGYILFISDGAYLTNSDGSIYEVATPYAVADVWNIRWVQSADVLTIAHPSYPLYNLSRSGETDWTLAEISFAAGIDAPTGVSAVATNGNAGNTGTTPGISSVTVVPEETENGWWKILLISWLNARSTGRRSLMWNACPGRISAGQQPNLCKFASRGLISFIYDRFMLTFAHMCAIAWTWKPLISLSVSAASPTGMAGT